MNWGWKTPWDRTNPFTAEAATTLTVPMVPYYSILTPDRYRIFASAATWKISATNIDAFSRRKTCPHGLLNFEPTAHQSPSWFLVFHDNGKVKQYRPEKFWDSPCRAQTPYLYSEAWHHSVLKGSDSSLLQRGRGDFWLSFLFWSMTFGSRTL